MIDIIRKSNLNNSEGTINELDYTIYSTSSVLLNQFDSNCADGASICLDDLGNYISEDNNVSEFNGTTINSVYMDDDQFDLNYTAPYSVDIEPAEAYIEITESSTIRSLFSRVYLNKASNSLSKLIKTSRKSNDSIDKPLTTNHSSESNEDSSFININENLSTSDSLVNDSATIAEFLGDEELGTTMEFITESIGNTVFEDNKETFNKEEKTSLEYDPHTRCKLLKTKNY